MARFWRLQMSECRVDLQPLMMRMAKLTARPLSGFSSQWKMLPQKIVEIAPTKPHPATTDGMVLIPAGKYRFKVSGVEIEGDDAHGVDVQYPWETQPQRSHDKELDIKAFLIDKYPVTNAQFKKFVDASGYRPTDNHNFLKDWKNGAYPDGWGNKPVTWVSIEDARGLRSVGGQTIAARMGMAIRGPRQRRPALPVGHGRKRRRDSEA